MSEIKNDLKGVTDKIENLGDNLDNKIENLKEREEKFKILDEEAQNIISKQSEVVKFNVSGEHFATRPETLLNVKDSLFYKIVLSKKFDLSKEIFIDRSNKHFGLLLDYLRDSSPDSLISKKAAEVEKKNKENETENKDKKPEFYDAQKERLVKLFSGLSSEDLEELKFEADYYELIDIVNELDERLKEPVFVSFDFSGAYNSGGTVIGNNKVESINDPSLTTGICATSPGWITLELNYVFDLVGLQVGGYTGNTTYWAASNGSGASILLSTDNSTWTTVGTIPSTYSTTAATVSFARQSAKYIKFQHSSYLGIGYVKVIKA